MTYANWSPYTTYSVNDTVFYNLLDWACVAVNTNQPPAVGLGFWNHIGTGGGTVTPTARFIIPVNETPQYTLAPQTTSLWNSTTNVYQYGNNQLIRLVRMACPTNDRRQIVDSNGNTFLTTQWIAFMGGFFNGGAVASNQAWLYDNGGTWWCRYSNVSGGADNWLTIIFIHNCMGTVCQAGSSNDA